VAWFRRGRAVPLVLLAILAIAKFVDPPPLQVLEFRGFDLLSQIFPRQPDPETPVVIVDLDEASLAAYGQWPWPRTLVATLLERLAENGAAVVGFDVLFAEPDRLSPPLLAKQLPQIDDAARATLSASPSNEAVLATAMEKTPVILGVAAEAGGGVKRETPRATPIVAIGENPAPYLLQFDGLVAAVPELTRNAAGNGLLTIVPELDGVARRMPVLVHSNGAVFPTIAIEAIRVFIGRPSYVVRTGAGGVEELIFDGGDLVIPTDERGRVWLRFAPHRPALFISAKKLLDGDRVPVVEGRIVLVGTSALGLLDIKATPLDAAVPGVEVHAQLIETIHSGQYLTRAAWMKGAEVWLLVACGLLLIALMPVVGASWGAGIALVTAASLAGAAAWLFAGAGVLFDVTMPLIAVALLYGALAYTGYRREEVERQFIRGAFGRYLAPAIVESLASQPDWLTLGGELRTISLMFCDIRGFTLISEHFRDDPQALTRLVNSFMTPMTRVILARRGTIDKYIGDCIMAFWNAPLDDRDHARNAALAAMDMASALKTVNASLQAGQTGSRAYNEAKALAESGDDAALAAELFKQEAERGFPNAQYNLAKAYRDSSGLPADQAEATRWFRAAAEQGHVRSQERLGARLIEGAGIPADPETGMAWLTIAAENGLDSARLLREQALVRGVAVDEARVAARIATLRETIRRQGIFELDMGIGLNTGQCVVGNLGSDVRFDYSALRDPVNLASRLEGLTKTYGVNIVAGESLVDNAKDLASLELDLVAVKGKSQAIRVYALLGDAEAAAAPAFRALSAAQTGMLKAYRASDWPAARRWLDECRRLHNGSMTELYEIYAERLTQLEVRPAGAEWQGVYQARTK
jgi:adenylate cyclase